MRVSNRCVICAHVKYVHLKSGKKITAEEYHKLKFKYDVVGCFCSGCGVSYALETMPDDSHVMK